MFKYKVIIGILSLFLIANVHSAEMVKRRQSNHFDILIFTQRWPPTVCYTWKETSPSHTCALPSKRDEWTIHGLWPSVFHKLGPQFCDNSMSFNPNSLNSVRTELEEKWIDIEYGRESTGLWKHEWDKHGTCAATLPQLNSEFKYFQEGLHLLDTYDMKNVLAKVNILPGKSYNVNTIFNAIERVLGKRGTVICRNNKNTGEEYIFEIRICFDKTLQLTHCDGVVGYPTNCGDQAVKYPGEVPHYYSVIQE